MDIVFRLKQFMNYVGMPSSQFADTALIPRPTLSQILNGRNKKISNELITKLHSAFPALNVLWLMFGDGNMVIDSNDDNLSLDNLKNNAVGEIQHNQNDNVNMQPQLDLNFVNGNVDINTEKNILQPDPKLNYGKIYFKPSVETVDTPTDQKLKSTKDKQEISAPSSSKKIQTIMVFYNDSSFEIFTPSEQK